MNLFLNKIRILILFYMALVSSIHLQAQERTALVLNPANDWPAFGLTAKWLVPLLNSQNIETKYYAFNDNPKPFKIKNSDGSTTDYPFKMFEGMPAVASPIQFFKDSIENLVRNSARSNLIVFVTHGGSDKKNPLKPGKEDTGIYVDSKNRLYFSDIAQIVKKNKQPEKKLKFVAASCYGNGTHQIAIQNENTCGLGYSDVEVFYPTTTAEPNLINMFVGINGVSNDLDRSGIYSLLDQYLMLVTKNVGVLSGKESSGKNSNRSKLASMSLSSMHYAEIILGRTDHHSSFKPNLNTAIYGLLQKIQSSMFFCDEINSNKFSETAPQNVAILSAALNRKKSSSLTDLVCRNRDSRDSLNTTSAENIATFDDVISDLTKNPNKYLIGINKEELKSLPIEFQNAFNLSYNYLLPQIGQASNQLKATINTILPLIEQHIQLGQQYQHCQSDCKLSELQASLLKLNVDIRIKLDEAINNIQFYNDQYEILMRFKVLAEAMKQAIPEQKQKLISLMRCELESF